MGARDGAGAEVCEPGFSPGASPISRANGLAHLTSAVCTAPGLAEGLPLHTPQKILPNSGGWGFDPESPAHFMASHLHPNPGRRSQNVESLRFNPGDSGSHPLANPLPIRVPGSRWETRTLRDPDPGSSPVTESSWPPTMATSKALGCIWPAPALVDRQGPGLWEGPRVTAPVGAQMLAPSLQLCTSPPCFLTHFLSRSSKS